MGYNGRSCILRALCESGQRFMGTATNMIEELIRSVFTWVLLLSTFSMKVCRSKGRPFYTFCNYSYLFVFFHFSLPNTKVLPFEPTDLHEYDAAHRLGKKKVHCSAAYRDCSISLIDLTFGRYSKPSLFDAM